MRKYIHIFIYIFVMIIVCACNHDIYMHNIVDGSTLSDESIYTVVEVQPQFPGGAENMMKYISQNLHYPDEESCINGWPIVHFVVEKDGSIDSVTIEKSVYKSWDDEAIRLIKSMPKWIPGSHEGNPVRVRLFLPLRVCRRDQ